MTSPADMPATRGLIERDAEVGAIRAAAVAARAGHGSLILVEGPPGIGKTALLQAAKQAAVELDLVTFVARGGALEHEFPYGVMRQLFESVLRSADEQERDVLLAGPARPAGILLDSGDGPPGDPPAIEHAFYWLALNLADTHPIVLIVDDAHWADRPSLRSLIYLARRTAELGMMVVVGSRTVDGLGSDLLTRLHAEATSIIAPLPLTEHAVGSLVHRRLAAADEVFCDACHAATGGNPFLVSQLIAAIEASGIDPVADNAGRLRSVGADRVRRSVLLRLAELSPSARPVSRALAVFGDCQTAAGLAQLAGLNVLDTLSTLDELQRAQIVADGTPIRFVHNIVQAAVYEDIDAGARSRLHAVAARHLAERGSSLDAVAAHLLLVTPGTDAWIVQQLLAAASTGLALSAADTAAVYLHRALQEDVPGVDRAQLLLYLGGARFQTAEGGAVQPLTEALGLATEPAMRLEIIRALASALMTEQRYDEGWAVVDSGLAEFENRTEVLTDLQTFAAMGMYSSVAGPYEHRELVRTWQPDPAGRTPRDRTMLAIQAWVEMTEASDGAAAAAKGRTALSTGTILDDDIWYVSWEMAVWSLVAAGCYDEALAELDRALPSRREIGRLVRAASVQLLRAELYRRLGRLDRAEEDARIAVEVIPPGHIYAAQSASALVMTLVDRDELEAAWQVLREHGVHQDIPTGGVNDIIWLARGYLRAAEGDSDGALSDVLRFGEISESLHRRNPAHWPWRSTAAQLMARLQRGDAARVLAQEELELALRIGNPDAVAIAQVALGVTQPGDAGLELLAAAVARLERSPLDLERARAQLVFGRELRQARRRGPARDQLRAALDTATRIGASGIAAAAQRELVAAGARPRRSALSGVDALTPSERRVAALAAKGMTNRELAHALYVTPKTVEAHLASTYRKLGVSGKAALAALVAESALGL